MQSVFLKKIFVSVMLLFAFASLTGCGAKQNNGESVLVVRVVSDANEVSETALAKSALQSGGEISINVALARELDIEFDAKYTNCNADGKFLVQPALLNFIAGNGWSFKQLFCINMNEENAKYFFTKPRL